MALSSFILRVTKQGSVTVINERGKHTNFNYALSEGKTVHQTQSNPDSDGTVIITITIEH